MQLFLLFTPRRIACVFWLVEVESVWLNGAMRKRVPDVVAPVLMPEAAAWSTLQDVEAYVQACIEACGLVGWTMQWDRAVRRLGCCKMTRRVITLSRYFVEQYLQRDPGAVRATALHELAHALAWEHYGESRHGEAWRYYCAVLGIPNERATCRCEDFAPPHLRRRARFALVNAETGEVYRVYTRRPSMSAQRLARSYIPGRREATLGKLRIVEVRSDAGLRGYNEG